MSQSSARRIATAALTLALTLPWTAGAAPHRTAHRARAGSPAAAGVLTAVKGWLTNLWAANGCIIIPDGRCLSGAPQNPSGTSSPTTDNGCIADPDGRCKAGQ
jgi:hypothetical protein